MVSRKMVVLYSDDNMERIYADHAATTPVDPQVLECMMPFLSSDYSNPSQPYSFSKDSKNALNEARKSIAKSINANPDEIYFTSGGSESNNWAILGSTLLKKNKREIITTSIEHQSVLNVCRALAEHGIETHYLNTSKEGVITPHCLMDAISSKVGLVSIMMANNEIATIQDIKSLSIIAHESEALFHSDAVQAVGHIKIDVKDLSVDLLSASAHKFNGPKGIGFLYIRNGVDISPLICGGGQERHYRAGTENVASIVGMAKALSINNKRMIEYQEKMKLLEKTFLDTLMDNNLDFIRNGSENHILGNISVSFKDVNGESLLHLLDLRKISISTGSACNGGKDTISHVITSIGIPKEYAKGTIRVSFGFENTIADAKTIADSISELISMK